jgi:hypothetical protein
MNIQIPTYSNIATVTSPSDWGGLAGTASWADKLTPDNNKSIPVPEWVEKFEGFSEEAYELETVPRTIVVQYVPTTTLGVGFTMIHLVDSKFGGRVPMMDSMYKVLHDAQQESILGNGYTITEGGIIRGAFGCPNIGIISSIGASLRDIYYEWVDFPNETDYEMVKKLQSAKMKVVAMNHQANSKEIEKGIEKYRRKIQEAQESIAKLEKELTGIYEEAADALNLLEEHGVDVSESDKWDGRKLGEGFAVEFPFNLDDLTTPFKLDDLTVAYDSSKILNTNPDTWATSASRMGSVDGTGGPCQIVFSDEESERIVRDSLSSCCSSGIGVSSAS